MKVSASLNSFVHPVWEASVPIDTSVVHVCHLLLQGPDMLELASVPCDTNVVHVSQMLHEDTSTDIPDLVSNLAAPARGCPQT